MNKLNELNGPLKSNLLKVNIQLFTIIDMIEESGKIVNDL